MCLFMMVFLFGKSRDLMIIRINVTMVVVSLMCISEILKSRFFFVSFTFMCIGSSFNMVSVFVMSAR